MKAKKIFGLVVAAVLCLSTSITAFAAGLTNDEQAILDKLKAGVKVDGKVVEVPASYLNQAENALMKTNVTAAQADAVMSKIDQAQAIIKKDGITSVAELKKSDDAKEILGLAQSAAKEVGYTVAYNAAKGVITVSDKSGNNVLTSKNVINQTGFDLSTTLLAGGLMITLLAACALIARRKKLFVKTVEA